MFRQIKSYIGIALVALVGVGAGLAAIFRNQRDKAVAEREKAETDLNRVIEANEHNQHANEVKDAIETKRDKIDSLSNSDVDAGMQRYDRARSNKD